MFGLGSSSPDCCKAPIASFSKCASANAFARDQLERVCLDYEISSRSAAAARRLVHERQAKAHRLLEAGKHRDSAIRRAAASKEEQDQRRHRRIIVEAEERARDRQLRAQNTLAARERKKVELAEHNRAEEEKRQLMHSKVVGEEAMERVRLAHSIDEQEAAGRRRLQAVARQREQQRVQRAATLEVQLQRAQSVRALKEAWVEDRVKAAALERAHHAETRVADAAAAKQREQQAYARRNAEEEARRLHAIRSIAGREMKERERLAEEIVAQSLAGERRVATVAALQGAQSAERAAKVQVQLERAARAKMSQEAMRQAETEAKVRSAAAYQHGLRNPLTTFI